MRPVTLVTGASAGLGAEFARQCAARGDELVLVARRKDRLDALAAEVGGKVHAIAADLAAPDAAEALAARVEALGLHVDILVNNAGFGLAGRFADLPFDRQREMIDLNIRPMPTPEELNAYYQGFTYSLPNAGELDRQIAYTRRGTERFVPIVERLLKRPIGKALDFGGGLGFFANALADHAGEVTLFDLDAQSREFARKRFNGRFRVVDSAEAAQADRYDLILLNQVIEHVPDPIEFLRPFRDALEPGGVLIVTTPNNRANDPAIRPDVLYHYLRRLKMPAPRALGLLAQDSWLCCDPPRHLYAFNGDNLSKVAGQAGFGPLEVTTAYFDDDPFGQPKYRFAGVGSLRNVAMSGLFALTTLAGPIARVIDRRKRRGTTLIGYFTV